MDTGVRTFSSICTPSFASFKRDCPCDVWLFIDPDTWCHAGEIVRGYHVDCTHKACRPRTSITTLMLIGLSSFGRGLPSLLVKRNKANHFSCIKSIHKYSAITQARPLLPLSRWLPFDLLVGAFNSSREPKRDDTYGGVRVRFTHAIPMFIENTYV